MSWRLNEGILNIEAEFKSADFPLIRELRFDWEPRVVPVFSGGGKWKTAAQPKINFENMSATAYFFAREIHQKTGFPVGIVNVSWPGIGIASLVSEEKLIAGSYQKYLDQIAAIRKDIAERPQLVAEWEEKNKEVLEPSEAEKRYAVPDFNDAEWKTDDLPRYTAAFNTKGVGWFRKAVEIPAEWAEKDLVLHLSKVDNDDITYWNGVEVGRTFGWATLRQYRIPARLVQAGKTVIAVRVMNLYGDGGIYDYTERLEIAPVGSETPLSLVGAWKYCIGADHMPTKVPVPPSSPGTMSPNHPSSLFRTFVEPIVRFPVKGAIFYQGESNVGLFKEYETLFPDLINDWRERWGVDFPFYFCQLANNGRKQTDAKGSDYWSVFRESQAKALSLPNTGMAVLIDNAGPDDDVHPKNKQMVGRRLALLARKHCYGELKLEANGPVFKAMGIQNGEVVVTFEHVGDGLKFKDGAKTAKGEDVGFTLAGEDGKYVWADECVIDGARITLKSAAVREPVFVRYAWATNPVAGLYNAEDLPACPFRAGEKEEK